MAMPAFEQRPDYRLRAARSDEVGVLQAIDIRSAELFRGTGLIDFGPPDTLPDPIPEDRLRRGFAEGLVWVMADQRGRPVGFALADVRGEDLYLDQVSVLPEHGRQGLGARLVRRVVEEAERRGLRRVSLSTFRKVAWNGPFYRSLGFLEIPPWRLRDWQRGLSEIQKQTMDVRLRCFMQKPVRHPPWLVHPKPGPNLP